ncbi:hypothetical protein CSB45_08665 [candidate division KSB3 bacterium]|uniref:CRISPR type III-associated protein domain-containing protein n=1 Tax=candidate division KSB3 bacterium TaxID=2044937 RepID=A0A2G6E4J2_9BACT|nr:MAG: hypothetical protein CSB45_08665 [candidate division KSB3 bacterium]PIE29707.1 MAG: hypothetical protein CSA57_07770 [candidate division KSB3 bacterium]
MSDYTITLTLESPTLIGSGEGFGARIDTDVVFDDVGLPYCPAKRVKGVLLDAALEVQEMLELAESDTRLEIERAFGIPGQFQSTPVYFSNLTLQEYGRNYAWLQYLLANKEYSDILSRDKISEVLSEVRQQTAIDENGVAQQSSLRRIRVLRVGLVFSGTISIDIEDTLQKKSILNTLILACANFRAFGTKRNRGFGDVQCALFDGEQNLSLQDAWKEVVECSV